MDLAQVAAMGILLYKGSINMLAIAGVLLIAQLPMQRILIASPRDKAVWYNAFGTLLYVLSMMVAAVGIRP
jgi:chlorophyll synthase